MAEDKKVNPFNEGTTYPEFLKAIPKGTKVADYCKDFLSKEEIVWLETELEHYNNNLKK